MILENLPLTPYRARLLAQMASPVPARVPQDPARRALRATGHVAGADGGGGAGILAELVAKAYMTFDGFVVS